MATALCPGQFFFACDTTDMFIMVGLIIGIIIPVVVLMIFLWLRGDWGGTFYHADKSNIGVMFEAEGSVRAFHMRPFGGLKRVTTGDLKDSYVVPRPNAAYKSPKAPMISLVVGGGVGYETNPFIAEYLERMGGKWPEWSPKPPKTAQDLRQMYLMYAEWKAKGEKNDADDKAKFIATRMAQLDPPPSLSQKQDIDAWLAMQRKDIEAQWDSGLWGPFTVMATKLRTPTEPGDVKAEREIGGIYEALNSALVSEPRELWPTWIAGHMVDLRDVARFAGPVPASQTEAAMNKIEQALRKDAFNTLVKLAAFGIFILFCLVGAGIAFKLVAG